MQSLNASRHTCGGGAHAPIWQLPTWLRSRQPFTHSSEPLRARLTLRRPSEGLTITRAEAPAPARPTRPASSGGRGGGGRGGGGGAAGRSYQGRGGGGGGRGTQGRGGGGRGYQGRGGGSGRGAPQQGRGPPGQQQQQTGQTGQRPPQQGGDGGGYQQRPQQPGSDRQQQRPPSGYQQKQQQGSGGNQGYQRPYERQGGQQQQRSQQRDTRDGFVINNEIRVDEVRLLSETKEQLGVMSLEKALELAEEAEVDVVLISPDASPPVCRLVELSKYKYELEKARKEASKKSRAAQAVLKELKIRPNTDEHDYQVRLRSAIKFISKGDKVKLTCQFRGREMEFQNLGREMFERFIADLEKADGCGDVAVEKRPSMQGRALNMILGPKPAAV